MIFFKKCLFQYALMYYMHKDHQDGDGWRPVISGCNSNTLGQSNLLSDCIESIANSVENPYEVISSEDLLSRFEQFNCEVAKQIEIGADYDWRKEWQLIGSDVVSLFPSLSADRTALAVRKQAEKSPIRWENFDDKWIRLYIHLNRKLSTDVSSVSHLLPYKRKGCRGPEAGIGSREVKSNRCVLE